MRDLDFVKSKEFSDRHLDFYKRFMAEQMVKFRIASVREDTKEATDLVLVGITNIGAEGVRIGVRTLKVKYDKNGRPYPNMFTIRAKTQRGGRTELDKWLDGYYPDWYVFGWEKNGAIDSCVLVDVHVFKANGGFDYLENAYTVINRDGSGFKKLAVSKLFEYDCVLASYGIEKTASLFALTA